MCQVHQEGWVRKDFMIFVDSRYATSNMLRLFASCFMPPEPWHCSRGTSLLCFKLNIFAWFPQFEDCYPEGLIDFLFSFHSMPSLFAVSPCHGCHDSWWDWRIWGPSKSMDWWMGLVMLKYLWVFADELPKHWFVRVCHHWFMYLGCSTVYRFFACEDVLYRLMARWFWQACLGCIVLDQVIKSLATRSSLWAHGRSPVSRPLNLWCHWCWCCCTAVVGCCLLRLSSGLAWRDREECDMLCGSNKDWIQQHVGCVCFLQFSFQSLKATENLCVDGLVVG